MSEERMSRSQIQDLIDYVSKSIREEKLTKEEIISYVKKSGVGDSNASWIVHEADRRICYGDDKTDWDKLSDEAYERLNKECSPTDAPGDVSPDVVDKSKEESQNTNAADKDETARKQAEEEYARQMQMEEYNRQLREYRMNEYKRQMDEYNRQMQMEEYNRQLREYRMNEYNRQMDEYNRQMQMEEYNRQLREYRMNEYNRQVDEYNRQMEEYNRQLREYQMNEYNRHQKEAAITIQEPAEKVKDEVEGTASPDTSNSKSSTTTKNILGIQFKGRLRRNCFWPTYIAMCVISFVLELLTSLAEDSSIALIIGLIALLYLTLVGLGLCIRRLHDTGRSGWWLLIGLVPYIGAIILIIFCCLDSQPGTNKYGSNPKELA